MITQAAYAGMLFQSVGMLDCNVVQTTVDARCKLNYDSTEETEHAKFYHNTQLDISFAVRFLSRFMEVPFSDHLRASNT